MATTRLISGPLDASALARVLELGARSLAGFSTEFDDREETFSFESAELPGSPELAGVVDVVVEGRVDKKSPWEAFREALAWGAQPLGGLGMLTCYVAFEEENSRQRADYADLASIVVSRGEPLFSFSPSSSLVARDREYRKMFFERVAASGLLPMKVVDCGTHFTLDHTAEGRLVATDSEGDGRNASAFRCYRPGPEGSELVDLLRRFVETFGSGRIFASSWKSNVVRRGQFEAEREESAVLYERLRELGLPAMGHLLSVTVKIDSPERVALLPSLCGPKDVHEVRVAVFRCGRRSAAISARVSQRDVCLSVTAAGDLDAASLSKELGTALRPA